MSVRPSIKRILSSVFIISAITVSAFAADVKAGVVETSSVLNVRKSPSTSAQVLDRLPCGKKVVILESADGWHKVAACGLTGYVSADYVAVKDSAELEATDGVITGSLVNFRASPDLDADVLAKLPEKTTVRVIGVQSGWFKATCGEKTGFIHGDYLSLSSSGESAGSTASKSRAEEVIAYAKKFLGIKYRSGGTSPKKGFDCSGYTKYVFANFGITLNRTSSTQVKNCTSVKKSELKPGDLVFFANPKRSKSKIGHVGIYIGGNEFIHASSPGDVVKIDSMSSSYYSKYYISAGRIL